MHRWLRGGVKPAVDTVLVIASVATALTPPEFTHRHLPDEPDANRCFGRDDSSPVTAQANAMLEKIARVQPEALVDIHNTTGINPPYGVGHGLSTAQLALTHIFASRYMRSELSMATLMEAALPICPSVAIECGRRGDPDADAVAWSGLEAFLHKTELELHALPPEPMQILEQPHRVIVRPEVELRYGDAPIAGALTIQDRIDLHNFHELPAGSRLGWFTGDALPLIALGDRAQDVADDLFELRGAELRTRRRFVPVMVTLDATIARQDCLFYAMLASG